MLTRPSLTNSSARWRKSKRGDWLLRKRRKRMKLRRKERRRKLLLKVTMIMKMKKVAKQVQPMLAAPQP